MHEEALVVVNNMHDQLAALVSRVIRALQDRKVSPIEGVMLGSQGLQFALFVLAILQALTPELREEILYVLEHGEMVLPE